MALPKSDGLLRKDFDNVSNNSFTRGRFVITAACAGAEVDTKFLAALTSYCKKKKAKLRILPMRAHMRALQDQPAFYDTVIEEYVAKDHVFSKYIFNANLEAVDLQLNPQQIDPLSGITRLGRASMLVAHPKLTMTVIPTSNSTLPRMIHTTGVCTRPDYQENRQGRLADQDHKLAAVVVEIDGDRFHLRQLEADVDGSIVDLGVRFYPSGKIASERAESFVLGDIHAGQHDNTALWAWAEVCKLVKPKKMFIHDLFNGHSISHHMEKNMLERIELSEDINTLQKEIDITKSVLGLLSAMAPSDAPLYVVGSNHNEWLNRYLTEGRYVKDHVNFRTAIRLLAHEVDGRNALVSALDPQSKHIWLDRNDDHWIDGVQHGCHGDMGPNGAKGSADGLERAYGKVTHGHTHTPAIRRGVWSAGTSSVLRMGYNKGASNWLHASVLQYKGGMRQIIVALDGVWRAKNIGKVI